MSIKPTFQGEVQFRRWSDSSTQGVQVTFALPDADALEPLKAKAGKRFMAVLVEIGDDEAPVEPVRASFKPGPLCREAIDLCKLKEFQGWVELMGPFEKSEQGAKDFILTQCQVESRKEIDGFPDAATAFVEIIRIPFMKWQRERRSPA